jgi:hypothetical protein
MMQRNADKDVENGQLVVKMGRVSPPPAYEEIDPRGVSGDVSPVSPISALTPVEGGNVRVSAVGMAF